MKIVFDLDGTLIDSAPAILMNANAVLAEEALPAITAAQCRTFIGNGAGVFVERLEHASAGATEPLRLARMTARFLELYESSHDGTEAYPGAAATLDALRAAGWRLGLCTNKPIGPTRSVLAHFGWESVFDAVVGGDSLPVRKPDPAHLHAVIDALGGGPVIYVGDSEVDAETAHAAGVPFALYTPGYRKTPVATIAHSQAFDDFTTLPRIAQAMIRSMR
ncbi:phosphoglycolate phosphatase [Pararhodobacter sp. SW119]|uniref:phosphoglycolate phosphatase n=1 Tax=Pararhodobacter sp. SW119 TaxID=2780075 RepID=UPI001AE0BD7B|nr:phosphoglycolate phosphatase [Pararhodobacter sp. SW119]